MRPIRYSFLCALLLMVTALSGQQTYLLKVSVDDAETGARLGFANLQIAGTTTGGTTDDSGSWETRLAPGQYQVVASLIGYASDTLAFELTAPKELSLHLRPAAQTLNTVTVTTDDAQLRMTRALMGVEQLNIEEIKLLPLALGEFDVFKGLQLTSGVSSAGEASNGLSVRGGTLDQNLLLLDDAPVFTPTHLFGIFSVFTPDAVENINLYRGNIPSRYGGRISSVVDVRNRNPNSDKFKLRGGIGLVSSRLAIETPLTRDKKLQVLAAGRVGVNDFVLRFSEELENTRSRFSDATLKLRWLANDNNIFTFSGFFSQDFYQLDLLTAFRGIIAENNQYAYRTLNGTAEWLRVLGERSNLVTKVIRADHVPKLLFPEFDSDNVIEFQSGIRQTELRSTLDYRVGKHQFSFGGQLIRYDLNPGQLNPGTSNAVGFQQLDAEQGLEVSLYLEDEWNIGDVATLSAGLRYTQFRQLGPGTVRTYALGEEIREEQLVGTEEFGAGESLQTYSGFEPRLGLSVKLTDRLRFKAAYALTRQYLQNIYNSTTPLPTSRWKLSDKFLQPQRAGLISGGLYAVLPGKGGYEISLEGYYRDIQNLLEYKPGADFFLDPSVETELLQGQGRAYGIELGLQKSKGQWTARANYTYSRVQNLVQGNSFSTNINRGEWYNGYFDQPHTFNGSLNFDDGKNNRVGFTLVAQSNRPFTQPNGVVEIGDLVVPLFLERNNARMPTYHRLDFSWTVYNMSMRKKRWKGEWTLTAYNLYGRRNAINVYYQPRL
ncbi:MAG: TonB-dependent receptor, partial [Bacteroidota bacterium]